MSSHFIPIFYRESAYSTYGTTYQNQVNFELLAIFDVSKKLVLCSFVIYCPSTTLGVEMTGSHAIVKCDVLPPCQT